MRLAWLTDIHLNFLNPPQLERLVTEVRATQADAIAISGDIGEAPRVVWYLERLEKAWSRPIYFVLGNHDYYQGSLAEVRQAVRQAVQESRWLCWLTAAGIIELVPGVALIGHDAWADGRLGDYANSDIMLNDYLIIRELSGLSKMDRLKQLNSLGDEAAAHFREWLPRALADHRRVYLLTHIPPFREACWHDGQISDDYFLPHFACKATGEALVEIMAAHPEHQLTVLCGHTHGQGEVDILPNLRVLTGGADYGRPEVQQVFEINS